MRIQDKDIDIRPLDPLSADLFRRFCTQMGLPNVCPFKACRRSRRCATAEVLCYQVLREKINAILQPALRARARGEPMPELPSTPEGWDAFFADRWPDSATPDKLDGT